MEKIFIVIGEDLHELAYLEDDTVGQILGVRDSLEKALIKKEEEKGNWFKIVIEVWHINGELIERISD